MWQISVVTVAPSQTTISSEYLCFAGPELPVVRVKNFHREVVWCLWEEIFPAAQRYYQQEHRPFSRGQLTPAINTISVLITVLNYFLLNLPALSTVPSKFWIFAVFLCHKRSGFPTNADSNVHSHCFNFCSRLSRWLFSVATSCHITYAAHRRGGCVSALGGEHSYARLCAQNDPFKSFVAYVHWHPLRWIGAADGSKSLISLWRWVAALVAIRLNWRRVIHVLSSSVANTVEAADRWNAWGLSCKVNFSGMKWRNEINCSGSCKLA